MHIVRWGRCKHNSKLTIWWQKTQYQCDCFSRQANGTSAWLSELVLRQRTLSAHQVTPWTTSVLDSLLPNGQHNVFPQLLRVVGLTSANGVFNKGKTICSSGNFMNQNVIQFYQNQWINFCFCTVINEDCLTYTFLCLHHSDRNMKCLWILIDTVDKKKVL